MMSKNKIPKLNSALPSDEELLRREKLFSGLIDKFSVDEGDDAELADFGSSDEVVEDESEASLSESNGEIDTDSDGSDAEEIKRQLEPVIQTRKKNWAKNGTDLQFRTVDPRVSVEDWLKANQEFTTTTKKYTKTVVDEDRRTTTTITKHTRTTTKKASFNSFAPRFAAIKEADSPHPKVLEPEASNDDSDIQLTNTKAKKEVKKKKKAKVKLSKMSRKAEKGISPVKVKIGLQKLVDLPFKNKLPELTSESKIQKTQKTVSQPEQNNLESNDMSPENGNKRCLRPRLNPGIVNQIQPKEIRKKQPKVLASKKNKLSKPNDETQLQSKNLKSASVVPVEEDDQTTHRSRSPLKKIETNRASVVRSKNNSKTAQRTVSPLREFYLEMNRGSVVPNQKKSEGQIQSKEIQKKQPKVLASKKNKTNDETQLQSKNLKSASVVPVEEDDQTIHRSRSPLKKIETNRASVVRSKKNSETAQRSTPLREFYLEMNRGSVVPNQEKSESVQRYRSPLKERNKEPKLRTLKVKLTRMLPTRKSVRNQKNNSNELIQSESNSQSANNYDKSVIHSVDDLSAYRCRKLRTRKLTEHLMPKRKIVIHSPSSAAPFGTKINDTSMLVTKRDIVKRLDPRDLRKINVKDAIVPIDRRIVYECADIDTIDENSEEDSECEDSEREDVLLTSYANCGHITYYKK